MKIGEYNASKWYEFPEKNDVSSRESPKFLRIYDLETFPICSNCTLVLISWHIYIIKNGFCGSVCPNTRHASISQPISKLSTSTDSPGTGAVVKNTLEAIGAKTKKF